MPLLNLMIARRVLCNRQLTSVLSGYNPCRGGITDWAYSYAASNGAVNPEIVYPYIGKVSTHHTCRHRQFFIRSFHCSFYRQQRILWPIIFAVYIASTQSISPNESNNKPTCYTRHSYPRTQTCYFSSKSV
jgi:hypothetical protein